MKKLMIAMSAATVFALGSYAASGNINFENMPEGCLDAATGALNIGVDDAGGSGDRLWASDAVTEAPWLVESTVVEDGEGNHFLKVDETGSLQRLMETTPQPIDGDITIDVDVQFTAADDAPETSQGDKILVWLKAADEENNTPAAVMVTAAPSGENKDGIYVLTELDADAVAALQDTWYHLTIKAVASGQANTQAATALFTVTLKQGDTVLGTGEYESLVMGQLNAQSISSIGFKGTGAVDNIAFEATAAAQPVTVTVAGITIGEDVESVDLGKDAEVAYDAENGISAMPGEDLIIWISPAEGKTVVSASVGETALELTEGENGWKIVYTVTEATTQTIKIVVTDEEEPPTPPTPGTLNWDTVSEETELADVIVLPGVTAGSVGDVVTFLSGKGFEATDVAAWMKAKGGVESGSATAIAAGIFDLEAFAMNCAPAEKEAKNAALKVSITMVDGEPVVTIEGDTTFNIKAVKKGKVTLADTEWQKVEGYKDEEHPLQFFRAIIDLPTLTPEASEPEAEEAAE